MPRPSTPELDRLIERARTADGQPPFSDQSLVDLRQGSRELLLSFSGAAIIGGGELELVIDPDARGRGNGTALLDAVLSTTTGYLLAWSHGDHPAARALAASHRFEPVRTLLQLQGPVVDPVETPLVTTPISTSSITAFGAGQDEEEWIALNARIFAFHAEQGSVTLADLTELESEPWFTAEDFIVAREDGRMVGYCWLKIEGRTGEIYVIGVDPGRQRDGLGRALMAAAYARLAARGIRTVHLYVEGDNAPALSLYRSLGFTDHSVDIQYRLSR